MNPLKFELIGKNNSFLGPFGNQVAMVTRQQLGGKGAHQEDHFEWSHNICSSKMKRQTKTMKVRQHKTTIAQKHNKMKIRISNDATGMTLKI